ncbi:DUF393 domain-containing protein [Tamlana haliotis]|uniref:DUF393 domain-containing protein n=1 Tax=Pseudotamlana haliotis TaxID=2614804 RepID=A0A6N6MMW1_9FLAO|nr:DCC1-like thiol-disulfide oxidoreductase family protein [Tamlana haliotis]KAB1071271.1 DUF393 domain-containing protein [Tamlana haliotis]
MKKENIVFFDGVCNLCNGFINFVISRDKNGTIYYATLQSDFAKSTLKDEFIQENTSDFSTIYFYTNNTLYTKSSAVLRVFSKLSPSYAIFAKVLMIIPEFIRDGLYSFIAKNRYVFFGKKSTCRIPTENERKQFI